MNKQLPAVIPEPKIEICLSSPYSVPEKALELYGPGYYLFATIFPEFIEFFPEFIEFYKVRKEYEGYIKKGEIK